MELTDVVDFVRLSSALHHHMRARPHGPANVLAIIKGRKDLAPESCAILREMIEYLIAAYGDQTRRLGPPAVLHPIRACALLARASDELNLLDLLCELLHDKNEDLRADMHPPGVWSALEETFSGIIHRVDPTSTWFLFERMDHLTRRKEQETYVQYIGRLLGRSSSTPELVRVKLADRLDNTLDMRIVLEDPLDQVDFFAALFELLYSRSSRPFEPALPHPVPSALNGASRLYELYKNLAVLALCRNAGLAEGGHPADSRLMDAIAVASMKEAERTVWHVFAYHFTDVDKQRRLVLEVMDYCQHGGIDELREPGSSNLLDGVCKERFEWADAHEREAKLADLYADKQLMASVALAFTAVFRSFHANPAFNVAGIAADGTVGSTPPEVAAL
jgi:hypothetical protein